MRKLVRKFYKNTKKKQDDAESMHFDTRPSGVPIIIFIPPGFLGESDSLSSPMHELELRHSKLTQTQREISKPISATVTQIKLNESSVLIRQNCVDLPVEPKVRKPTLLHIYCIYIVSNKYQKLIAAQTI